MFFIISGILVATEIERNRFKNPLCYLRHRYVKLYPKYIIYEITYFLCYFLFQQLRGAALFREIKKSFLEFLGLQILGIGEYATNHGAVWYISVLIVSSYIVFTLLYVNKALFQYLIGPFLVIAGYLFLFIQNGSVISGWWNPDKSIFSNMALLRGIAGVSLGVILFYLADNVKMRYERVYYFEIIAFCAAVFIGATNGNSWLFLVCISACIFICLIGKHDNILFNNKILNRLAEISYSIYLIHPLFLDFGFMDKIRVSDKWGRGAILLIMVTFFAFLFDYLVNYFIEILRIVTNKVRLRSKANV